MKRSFGKKSRRVNPGQVTVRVTKEGKFALSASAVTQIGIDQKKHRVRVECESEYEWYITIVEPGSSNYPEDAISFVNTSGSNKGLVFYLKAAAAMFLDNMGQEDGITFPLATTPDESAKHINFAERRYAILTARYVADIKENKIRTKPNDRFSIGSRIAMVSNKDEA